MNKISKVYDIHIYIWNVYLFILGLYDLDGKNYRYPSISYGQWLVFFSLGVRLYYCIRMIWGKCNGDNYITLKWLSEDILHIIIFIIIHSIKCPHTHTQT